MDGLLEQIERASGAGLYYVALFTTLTVPSICSALESPNGHASGNRYMKWVEAHLPGWDFPNAGKRLWDFRGSLLHEGTARPDERSKAPRLLFVEPGHDVHLHMTQMQNMGPAQESAFVVDVPTFCTEVVGAVREWLPSVQGTQPFEKNYTRFIRRHPQGLSPFVVGAPVVG